MKLGDVKIIDRISAVEATKQLNEEDLRFLNRMIVERLKLLSQARATMLTVINGTSHPVCCIQSEKQKVFNSSDLLP